MANIFLNTFHVLRVHIGEIFLSATFTVTAKKRRFARTFRNAFACTSKIFSTFLQFLLDKGESKEK